jgi:hypothetical protein
LAREILKRGGGEGRQGTAGPRGGQPDAAKARVQVGVFVTEVLTKHMPKEKAVALATALTEGRWTHDFPITVPMARQLGFPVTTTMPRTVYDLMDLYPQGARGRPSVLYVPLRPLMPERRETPKTPRAVPSGS